MRVRGKKGAGFAQISQIPLVKYVDPNHHHHNPIATSFSSPPSLHGVRLSMNAQDMVALAEGDIRHGDADNSDSSPAAANVRPFRTHQPDAAQSSASLHSDTSRRGRHSITHVHLLSPFVRLAHRLTRNKRQRAAELSLYKKQLKGPVPEFSPHDAEDSMCAICLNDYEDGDILRLLPCKHHMHQACVDEWLHINRSCPLCKREVIGEGAAQPSGPLEPVPVDSIELQQQTTSNAGTRLPHECSSDQPFDASSTSESRAGPAAMELPAPVSSMA
ncbi:hypothetical protein IW140_001539 [Coemansia sp. RSA 1813]|nr:hypothetical protein EV178_002944 [Coemansia sp. RSA 1646]KAJ1768737.1 hypothetical protein LPJ74_004633 [Coemansia sp. RSA 1843]KAJ2086740.1 hypothetical protein IW138_005468 [Coemansia sp. RSA 986]KAJ2211475.1 hypothetical protein EV179_005463 [Coemansia sp. RSA 487]KAJ2571621.1 hypothetical protein IW140_001539 [Coemansia sp. RSA 1813]